MLPVKYHPMGQFEQLQIGNSKPLASTLSGVCSYLDARSLIAFENSSRSLRDAIEEYYWKPYAHQHRFIPFMMDGDLPVRQTILKLFREYISYCSTSIGSVYCFDLNQEMNRGVKPSTVLGAKVRLDDYLRSPLEYLNKHPENIRKELKSSMLTPGDGYLFTLIPLMIEIGDEPSTSFVHYKFCALIDKHIDSQNPQKLEQISDKLIRYYYELVKGSQYMRELREHVFYWLEKADSQIAPGIVKLAKRIIEVEIENEDLQKPNFSLALRLNYQCGKEIEDLGNFLLAKGFRVEERGYSFKHFTKGLIKLEISEVASNRDITPLANLWRSIVDKQGIKMGSSDFLDIFEFGSRGNSGFPNGSIDLIRFIIAQKSEDKSLITDALHIILGIKNSNTAYLDSKPSIVKALLLLEYGAIGNAEVLKKLFQRLSFQMMPQEALEDDTIEAIKLVLSQGYAKVTEEVLLMFLNRICKGIPPNSVKDFLEFILTKNKVYLTSEPITVLLDKFVASHDVEGSQLLSDLIQILMKIGQAKPTASHVAKCSRNLFSGGKLRIAGQLLKAMLI